VKASLSGDRSRIVLDLAWNEPEIAKMVSGYRYLGKTKEHTVPLTYAALVTLRGLLGPAFEYDDEVAAWAWQERNQRVDPALFWREVVSIDNPDRTDLYPFQLIAMGWMIIAGSGLLGDELGCGKTPQGLAWLRETDRLPAIVICPNSVKWHWAARVPRWCPGATPYVIDGGTAKGRKALADRSPGSPRTATCG
jgi:hypothetical protein